MKDQYYQQKLLLGVAITLCALIIADDYTQHFTVWKGKALQGIMCLVIIIVFSAIRGYLIQRSDVRRKVQSTDRDIN